MSKLFTTTPKSLIHSGDFSIKANDTDNSQQVVRKGMSGNPRDRLEEQLSKGMCFITGPLPDQKRQSKGDDEGDNYGGKYLKNTHGEEHHSDNDKQAEFLQSDVDEVNSAFGTEKDENPMTGVSSRIGKDRPAPSIRRSLSQEDLVLKALDEISKSHPMPHAGTSKKAPAQAKDPAQAKQERQQRKELMGKWAKKSESLIDMVEDQNDPTFIANLHENSEGIAEKRHVEKSDIDELYDIIKGKACDKPSLKKNTPMPPPVTRPPNLSPSGVRAMAGAFKSNEDEQGVSLPQPVSGTNAKPSAPAFSRSFIKKAGPGGIIFDFGHITGNRMADQATALLNQHGDPVQASNAQYQANAYDKAIGDFVTKGDVEYDKSATPFGNIDKGWGKQLDTPLDQQVAEAFKKGELQEDRNAPAIKNDFNQTEINLGGNMIKATSETDAALIKMMLDQGHDLSGMDGGTVADVTSGGAQRVTADATSAT